MMQMSELIPVNIVIGDRSYRIRTRPEDEETIRGTVKLINDKIVDFKTQFAGKDMQDYIAMVIIWYATQQQSGEGDRSDLIPALSKLSAALDRALER